MRIVVSIPQQKMAIQDGFSSETYSVSTSKYGVGNVFKSLRTPLGEFVVIEKIGKGIESGTVFRHRSVTKEIVKPNAPGRKSIVTRIIRIQGTSKENSNTADRAIYIHGTPQENLIGKPASIGCVVMKSKDIIDVFDKINVGTKVFILNQPLPKINKFRTKQITLRTN